MRVALYARVSTQDQSSEAQLAALMEYVDRRGWTVNNAYVDEGCRAQESAGLSWTA
jgi:DNA invertase Pin-like site-specific DNA recombinase